MSEEEQDDIVEKVYQVLNMTPKDLALELDVTVQAVSKWKNRGVPEDKRKIMELMLKLNEKEKIIQKGSQFFESIQDGIEYFKNLPK